MRPGRDVDHPPHLTPRLKKEYGYTYTPPLGLCGLFYGVIYLTLFCYKRETEQGWGTLANRFRKLQTHRGGCGTLPG